MCTCMRTHVLANSHTRADTHALTQCTRMRTQAKLYEGKTGKELVGRVGCCGCVGIRARKLVYFRDEVRRLLQEVSRGAATAASSNTGSRSKDGGRQPPLAARRRAACCVPLHACAWVVAPALAALPAAAAAAALAVRLAAPYARTACHAHPPIRPGVATAIDLPACWHVSCH